MAKQKQRKKRRIIVAGGVAAAGTGAAAAARAQRRRSAEAAEAARKSATNPGESRMHRIADRTKSLLNTGKEKAVALAHKLRHPSGTKPA